MKRHIFTPKLYLTISKTLEFSNILYSTKRKASAVYNVIPSEKFDIIVAKIYVAVFIEK